MLTALQAYYLCASAILGLFALYSPRRALLAFVGAIGLNIFPLAVVSYMNMDIARIGAMPLVYLPATAVGLALILRNGLHFPKRYSTLYVLIGVFLVYTMCNTLLLRGWSAPNLAYWLAWPLNLLVFIATARWVAGMDPAFLNRLLHHLVILLVAASLVGLGRYATGFEPDANFIPLMNRNGTVVLIALLFPLVLHVHQAQNKSMLWLIFCGGTIALCVAMTFSRSGLIGLLFGLILYYGRFTLMGMVKFSLAGLAVVLFLASGVTERTTERLLLTGRTISALASGEEIDRSVGDRNRALLVQGAIDTAKQHIWLGTGLGMENYRAGLQRSTPLPLNSKSHNFYLSYLAELGVFGFVLLLAILHRIYTYLPPLNSRWRAFRVCFLVTAIMMTMNEYILLPELWLFFGLLTGIGRQLATGRYTAMLPGAPLSAAGMTRFPPATGHAPAHKLATGDSRG